MPNEKILEEFDDRLKEFVPTNTDQDIYLLAEDSKSFLSAKLDQARAEERERMGGEVNRFTVYYRSIFSQDCSRDETKEDKSTEMIELATLLASLGKPLT